MNNTGPVRNTAGPYFLTVDPPVGVDPLIGTLTGATPSQIAGTDPVSAAISAVTDWQMHLGETATSTTAAPAPAGSPWYTRGAVLVLAVLLVAIGTLVIAFPAVKGGVKAAAVA